MVVPVDLYDKYLVHGCRTPCGSKSADLDIPVLRFLLVVYNRATDPDVEEGLPDTDNFLLPVV